MIFNHICLAEYGNINFQFYGLLNYKFYELIPLFKTTNSNVKLYHAII